MSIDSGVRRSLSGVSSGSTAPASARSESKASWRAAGFLVTQSSSASNARREPCHHTLLTLAQRQPRPQRITGQHQIGDRPEFRHASGR